MRQAVELLSKERHARAFFLAHTQSSLGTGAAYVGLLLIAYDRLHSPWAIGLVLLADFLPSMFLGPVFGAAADRWSRRGCAVVGDVLRAIAFIGLAFVDGIGPTIALAMLAGVGTGLYTPALMAGLPSLVKRERLPAATSLYGAIADFGYTAGPAVAALGLLVASPETLMVANGLTFVASAVVLARIPFGAAPGERQSEPKSLLAEARDGAREAARIRGVRTIIFASAAVVLCAGLMNVGELLLATEELGTTGVGFSLLLVATGAGVIVGSLTGSRGGSKDQMKHRYILGMVATAAGLVACGLAPAYPVALAAFALVGVGNGVVLVHERLLLQTSVDDAVMGRIFGLKDGVTSWAYAFAFIGAGALLELIGTRELLVAAGAGTLLVALLADRALRPVEEVHEGATLPDLEPGHTGGLPPLDKPRPVPSSELV